VAERFYLAVVLYTVGVMALAFVMGMIVGVAVGSAW
jgi:hypothetical protein